VYFGCRRVSAFGASCQPALRVSRRCCPGPLFRGLRLRGGQAGEGLGRGGKPAGHGVGGQGGHDCTADAPVQQGAHDGQGAGEAGRSRALELQPYSASQGLQQHETAPERGEEVPAQSAPEPPAPPPPPSSGDVGRLLPADLRSDGRDDWSIIKHVAGRAIWSVAGFAAGCLVAAQGVRYNTELVHWTRQTKRRRSSLLFSD
jgi:hypothetical protein